MAGKASSSHAPSVVTVHRQSLATRGAAAAEKPRWYDFVLTAGDREEVFGARGLVVHLARSRVIGTSLIDALQVRALEVRCLVARLLLCVAAVLSV